MNGQSSVWLAAAENGAIPGGKVGGVGDVLRDLPLALAAEGCAVRVITPAYGKFHTLPGARLHRGLTVRFRGSSRYLQVFELPGTAPGVRQFVLEHPLLVAGEPGRVYFEDPPGHAFETDANRFALFCAALAAWVEKTDAPPEVLHLHDWHTGLTPWLLKAGLCRSVFTIHNLAYQGIRPLRGLPGSLEEWFPERAIDTDLLGDPRYSDCVNFMAAALRSADGVNTVSARYAQEILQPSDPRLGFVGGEGLEGVLRQVAARGRLAGILNGCEYPTPPRRPTWPELRRAVADRPGLLTDNTLLKALPVKRPRQLLLSVGRVVGQKVRLFLEPVAGFPTALDALLDGLGGDGLLVLLGNGEVPLEEALSAVAARRDNFLFLRGYAEALTDLLYPAADLFLMPSSFEPCGISQMLAMRAGTPCVVHGVGGLADTVVHGKTGFVFHGDTPGRQATALVTVVQAALALHRDQPAAWKALRKAAGAQRFSWQRAARSYLDGVYRDGG